MAVSTNDRRFLRLCDQARLNSHDPDRQVGAVIVSPTGEPISFGSNAPPTIFGLSTAQSHAAMLQDTSWKYFMLEHAERAAIFTAQRAGQSLVGATMYGTLYPCADCARAIVAAGISRLVVIGLSNDPVRDERWLQHHQYAQKIFKMAGTPVDLVDPAEIVRD